MSELLERHNFKFQKKYGQNFLTDVKIPQRIADNCTEYEKNEGRQIESAIVEIGPGAGILTKELAKQYKRVIAVEIDESLMPVLEESLSGYENITVLNEDIMKVDLNSLCEEITEHGKMPVSVCANLPYYITTPVIMKLIEDDCGFEYITVMVQKEVARRLCAKANDSDYGAITAQINLYGTVKKLFDVPAGCFYPKPNVDSTVVRIKLDNNLYTKEQRKGASALIKSAFAARRKTLVNAISSLGLEYSKEDLAKIISQTLPYDGSVRGEKLSAGDFVKLAERLYK